MSDLKYWLILFMQVIVVDELLHYELMCFDYNIICVLA